MASATPRPDGPAANTGALYDALENLKNEVVDIYDNELQNSGDLLAIRDRLGWVRDRSDNIQTAVIRMIDAIHEHL